MVQQHIQRKHNNATTLPTGEEEYLQSVSESGVSELATNSDIPLKPSNVLQLQRQLGNQATRMQSN